MKVSTANPTIPPSLVPLPCQSGKPAPPSCFCTVLLATPGKTDALQQRHESLPQSPKPPPLQTTWSTLCSAAWPS